MQLWFHKAIHYLPLDQIDLLFVENIGNLVCPSNYELDTHLNVILLSIPEREDKPENIFYFQTYFYVISLSAKTGEGLKRWIDFIEANINEYGQRLS